MKKLLALVLVLLFLLSLAGCNDSPVPSVTAPPQNTTGETQVPTETTSGIPHGVSFPLPSHWDSRKEKNNGTFTDEGYYFLDSQSLLRFVDLSNGNCVILCSKVGCSHENTPGSMCEAVLTGADVMDLQPLFYWDGAIYYTAYDHQGTHLYRRNADGTGMNRITTLGQEYAKQKKGFDIYEYLVSDGCLYYNAVVTSTIKDELSDSSLTVGELDVLHCVDLKTGRDRQLTQDEHHTLQIMAASENVVIYSSIESCDPADPDYTQKLLNASRQIVAMDKETGEKGVILDKTFRELRYFVGILNNTLLFRECSESGDQSLVCYDISTGQVLQQTAFEGVPNCVLNTKYALVYDADHDINTMLDLSAGQAIIGGVDGVRLIVQNINDEYFIVKQSFLAEGDADEDGGKQVAYSHLCFCSFSALEDGFQQEDLVPFYTIEYAHS